MKPFPISFLHVPLKIDPSSGAEVQLFVQDVSRLYDTLNAATLKSLRRARGIMMPDADPTIPVNIIINDG